MAFMSNAPPQSASRSGALVLAALAATCVLYPSTRITAETISGVARVVDGDTLVVKSQRIRLRAVDAPEMAQICQRGTEQQKCGIAARKAVESWLLDSEGVVTCVGSKRDLYGRLVAACDVRGEDIGRRLVREGLAIAYKRYGKDYVVEEAEAKEGQRGIWSTDFQRPEEWRRDKRKK